MSSDDKPTIKDKAIGTASKQKDRINRFTYPQEGQEGLDRDALFSLQETWGRTHHTQHQGVKDYNKDGSHKRAGGVPKPDKPASRKDRINFAQLIHTETRKAVCSAL